MIEIHITDSCNMNCNGCHWLSDKIVFSSIKISPEEWINFINKIPGREIVISGGEPLLFDGIEKIIEMSRKKIILYTNGLLIHKIKNFDSISNIFLSINTNDWQQRYDEVLVRTKKVKTISFNNLDADIFLKNQLTYKSSIIGKNVICTPNRRRIASDGREYFCEIGLRLKNDDLFTGNTINNFNFKIKKSNKCIATSMCMPCQLYENYIMEEA